MLQFYNCVFLFFSLFYVAAISSKPIESIAAFNADFIEYDLPKYNTKQWIVGDKITFTLPLNIKVTGSVETVQLFDGVHYFIDGSVPNAGWFSASYFEDSMNANINYMGNKQFELRPSLINKSTDINKKTYTMRNINVNDEYVVKEIDLDTESTAGDNSSSSPQTNTQSRLMTTTKNIQLQATVALKVLVLYTKQAVTTAGSESSLQATILLAIGNYNKANINSNVDVSVTYAAERMKEYDTYIEDPSMSVMLNQMGSGTISTARRYEVGAHAVQLVTANTQYCGLAGYSFSGQTNGNSVTYHGCIGGYLSLAHEVGHSIGLHHDLSVYPSAGPNHGSCWDVATSTGCRRSVMAYASCKTPTGRTNCDRVMYWSSPAISDSGNVIGDSTNCNNAQQLRDNIVRFTNLYTMSPVSQPTATVVVSTLTPTLTPSRAPTTKPIFLPTAQPIQLIGTAKPVYSPTTVPTSTPIKPTLSPTVAKPLVPYTYLGCYADAATRAMAANLGGVASVAACYNKAVASNYKYFGLQYGGECWVSNDLIKSEQYGLCGTLTQCVCTMACTSGDMCGNGYANSLYEIGPTAPEIIIVPSSAPITIDPFTYLGCYADSNPRAMVLRLSGTFPSISSCFNSASAGNYKYFGLQYGGECWVSNDYASTIQYGVCGTKIQCTCSMKCSNGDICGAGMTNSLYLNNYIADVFVPTVTPTATLGASNNGSTHGSTTSATIGITVGVLFCFLIVCVVLTLRYRSGKNNNHNDSAFGDVEQDGSKKGKKNVNQGSARGMNDIYSSNPAVSGDVVSAANVFTRTSVVHDNYDADDDSENRNDNNDDDDEMDDDVVRFEESSKFLPSSMPNSARNMSSSTKIINTGDNNNNTSLKDNMAAVFTSLKGLSHAISSKDDKPHSSEYKPIN